MSGDPTTISLRLEACDVGVLLEESLAPLAAHAARKDVALQVLTRSEAPRLDVDRHRLTWCVATLAGNALRRLRGAHAVGTGTCIRVEVSGAPGAVEISIGDDGPAVPIEQLLWLFEDHVGVVMADDLSLSLIREIVQAHRGSVQVAAKEGAGAGGVTITLRLPTTRLGPNP